MTYQQRTTILMAVFFGALALIVLRLFMVQIVFGPKYRELAADRILRTVTLQTTRGSITDRNGVVLASSRPNRFALSLDLAKLEELGKDNAAAVKKIEPSVPVILLTGFGEEMRAKGEAPECIDALLSKPPTLGRLRNGILEATARKLHN